jgi:MFS family permease
MSKDIAGRATPSVIPSGRRVTIALYAVAVFLFWISLYIYVPTLPNYVQTKTGSLAVVGVVLAQYGLWQAILRLPLGITADSLGRHKPLIIVGFLFSALGAVVMAEAQDVTQMGMGRAITGLAAATWVPLVVVFSALFPADETVRATAMLTFIGTSGRVLATGATGALNELGGYALAFYLAAGAALLAIIVVLPAQSQRRAPRKPSFPAITRLITRRDVLLPSILAAVSQFANWTATFSFTPILAQDLGANDIALSALLSLHLGVVLLGNLTATTLVNRSGARRLVYVSFLMLSGSLGLIAVAPSLLVIFVAQFFMGLSQGMGYPVLMGLSIRYVSDENRTTAMGLHQSVYAIGMFAGPWLSGILADAAGLRPMFGITAFFVAIAGLAGARMLSAKRERKQE